MCILQGDPKNGTPNLTRPKARNFWTEWQITYTIWKSFQFSTKSCNCNQILRVILFKRCVYKICASSLGETILECIVICIFFGSKHISCWRFINQKAHSRGTINVKLNFNKIDRIGSFGIKSFLQGRPVPPSSSRRLVTEESGPQPRGGQPSGLPRLEWAGAEGL